MTLSEMMGFGDSRGDVASDPVDMGTGAGAEGPAQYPSDIGIHFPRPFWVLRSLPFRSRRRELCKT
jgi:hypothetical protein